MTGPIILIEDDHEDAEIVRDVLRSIEVTNSLIICSNGEDAYNILLELTEHPLLIISDINMPKINGIELIKMIHANENLRKKSIPFIFFTTSAGKKEVIEAYDMTVQGFFIKGSSLKELRDSLKLIIDYWARCVHPMNYQPM